jgi:hypothetical protein
MVWMTSHEASLPAHEAYIDKYKLLVATEYYHVVITIKIWVNRMERRLEGEYKTYAERGKA